MINEEEKFNDLLRSKLNEREFFFDELNWDKAEQAIVREERNKKTRRVALIFLGGFILGAAIMFPVAALLTSNTKQKSVVTASTPVAINDNKNSAPANNTTPVTSPSSNAAQIQGPATTTASEPKDKNVTPAIADKASAGDKKSRKNKKAKAADNSDNYAYVRPASERKHKKPVENPYIDELPDNLKPKNSNVNNSSQNQEANNNSNSKNNTDKNTSVADNNKGSVNSPKQQNPAPNNSPSANNDKTAADNANASTDAKNNSQANNKTIANQAKVDSNKLKALVNPPVQNKDFISQENKIADVAKPAFKPTNSISIDAGGGYSLGWKNENGKGGSGITPVIGVRLNHGFSKKISLGIGLRYYGLTNLNCPYSNTLISYDFGYNSTRVSVSPQMLHYAAMPIEFQYHFNRNNIISLGGTLLYMVNSSSMVSTYTQNGIEAPTSQKKTVLGYTDGFNQFDGQLVIAYRRRLFGSFGASAEAYYGLMDVENNSFFLSNSFERNSGFRLILSYDIGK